MNKSVIQIELKPCIEWDGKELYPEIRVDDSEAMWGVYRVNDDYEPEFSDPPTICSTIEYRINYNGKFNISSSEIIKQTDGSSTLTFMMTLANK